MDSQSQLDGEQGNIIESGKCQVCSVPAQKSCSGCNLAYYCSLNHQSQHWKVHKMTCKGRKVYCLVQNVDNATAGHYVATRNLKAGIVVLKEFPVSYAPRKPAELDKDFIYRKRCCLGCHRFLEDQSLKCSKCSLPVCSTTCQEMPVHANNECQVYQKMYIADIGANFQDIFHLRTCLLKKNNPSAFDAVLNLPYGHVKNGKSIEMDKRIVQRMIEEVFIIPDIFTAEEWIKVVNVSLSNKIEISKIWYGDENVGYEKMCLQFLCLEASLFTHSCSPNCQLDFIPAEQNMKVIIRTATTVKKGDMLTIDYSGRNLLVGNYMRRRLNNLNACECHRCKDPSEVGSQLSTFVCPSCKAWEMMSTDPLLETADWKCKSCGTVEEGESKITLMNKLHKYVENIVMDVNCSGHLEDLLSEYSGKILHPNNWVLIEILLKLTRHIESISDDKDGGYLTDDQYNAYEIYAEQLISVYSLLAPGISVPTARLQYSLGKLLLKKLGIDVNQIKVTWKHYHKTVNRIKELFTEANIVFKNYVDGIDGRSCNSYRKTEKKLELMQLMYDEPPMLLTEDDDDKNEMVEKIRRLKASDDYF